MSDRWRHGRRVTDGVGAEARHLVDVDWVLALAEQRRDQLARASVVVGVRHLRPRLTLHGRDRVLDLRVHRLPRGAEVHREVAVEIVEAGVIDVQRIDAHLRHAAQDLCLEHVSALEEFLVGRVRVEDRGRELHAGFCVVNRKDQHKFTSAGYLIPPGRVQMLFVSGCLRIQDG
jgi:hypothetical protein